jgi:hypothetical protein
MLGPALAPPLGTNPGGISDVLESVGSRLEVPSGIVLL